MAVPNTSYPYDTIAYVTEVSGGLRYRGSGVLIGL